MHEVRDPVALFDSLQDRCSFLQAGFLALERDGLIPLPVALAWITTLRDEARAVDTRDLDAVERLANQFVRQNLMLDVGIPVPFLPGEPDGGERAAEKLRLFGPDMPEADVAAWAERMVRGVSRKRHEAWGSDLAFRRKLARLATLELIDVYWQTSGAGLIDKRALRRRIAAAWKAFHQAETLDDYRSVAEEASAAAIREEWRLHPAPPLPDPSEIERDVALVKEANDDRNEEPHGQGRPSGRSRRHP